MFRDPLFIGTPSARRWGVFMNGLNRLHTFRGNGVSLAFQFLNQYVRTVEGLL